MSDCCFGFESTQQDAVRTPNPKLMPLDQCNNKHEYDGLNGETFAWGTPVRATATPNEVEPALDGVGVIGMSVCDLTASVGNAKVTVARTGRLRWSDMAAAVGEGVNDQAAWWQWHQVYAALNIYVEFD